MLFEEAYQSQILNQSVSMFILKEQYETATNNILYENNLEILREEEESRLQKAGAWIKEKVQKFIKMIKDWLTKLKNFLFKTIPEFFKKRWNGLLIFLKIKKKPVVVDASEAKNKDELKQAANIVNKSANAQAMAQLTNDKKYAVAAQKIKSQAIKEIQAKAKENHLIGEYYYPMLKAVQNNQCVYLKMAQGTDNTVKGTIFDLDLGTKVVKRVTGTLDSVGDFEKLFDDMGFDENDAEKTLQAIKSAIEQSKKYTAEQVFKDCGVPSLEELKKSRKEVVADFKTVTKYLELKNGLEKLGSIIQSQYKEVEKQTNIGIQEMQKAANSPDVTNLDQQIINGTMTITRTLVNLLSSCCTRYNQYQSFMCNDIANFIKVCQPNIHE